MVEISDDTMNTVFRPATLQSLERADSSFLQNVSELLLDWCHITVTAVRATLKLCNPIPFFA
jgi:hypothetical protein